MILSLSIFLIILYILFKHYEYGVVLIAALYIWLDLFALTGSNILTYLSLVSLCLFICKKEYKGDLKQMPVRLALCVTGLSFFLTGFFAESPNIIPAILNCIREVGMIMIFYMVFQRNKEVLSKFYIKVSIVFASSFVGLTIIEMMTSNNPYIDFVTNIGAYRVDTYIDEMRYGFKRCQSVFSMHTTLGGTALLTCFPIAWNYYVVDKSENLIKVIFWIACAFLCAYASGARSTMVGCAIASIAFLKKSYFSPKYLVILLIFFVLVYTNFSSNIDEVYDSLINSDNVGGSDTDMRLEQLTISLKSLNQNFVLGNGIYAWTEIAQRTNLHGAESIWFGLMIDRGILGIISLVSFNIELFVYIFNKKIFRLVFFVVAFLVTSSMSSLPNIMYTLVVIPLMVMVSLYDNVNKHN